MSPPIPVVSVFAECPVDNAVLTEAKVYGNKFADFVNVRKLNTASTVGNVAGYEVLFKYIYNAVTVTIKKKINEPVMESKNITPPSQLSVHYLYITMIYSKVTQYKVRYYISTRLQELWAAKSYVITGTVLTGDYGYGDISSFVSTVLLDSYRIELGIVSNPVNDFANVAVYNEYLEIAFSFPITSASLSLCLSKIKPIEFHDCIIQDSYRGKTVTHKRKYLLAPYKVKQCAISISNVMNIALASGSIYTSYNANMTTVIGGTKVYNSPSSILLGGMTFYNITTQPYFHSNDFPHFLTQYVPSSGNELFVEVSLQRYRFWQTEDFHSKIGLSGYAYLISATANSSVVNGGSAYLYVGDGRTANIRDVITTDIIAYGNPPGYVYSFSHYTVPEYAVQPSLITQQAYVVQSFSASSKQAIRLTSGSKTQDITVIGDEPAELTGWILTAVFGTENFQVPLGIKNYGTVLKASLTVIQ